MASAARSCVKGPGEPERLHVACPAPQVCYAHCFDARQVFNQLCDPSQPFEAVGGQEGPRLWAA